MDIPVSLSSFGLLVAAPTAIPARMLYGTKETEALLSVSHAQLYRLIAAGRLDARKIGSRTFITNESIHEFIAALPKLAREE
jgi:excisionase family DNA binding protein